MDLLQRLNIKSVNPGAFSGHGWHSDNHAHTLESFNPSTGNKLAEIATCTIDDYEQVMQRAEQAAQAWRKVPAPKRGEIIRQIGQALRENKDSLGSLVSLEMGKSKQEGDGEVQEMIDIADFAVGQSRMLYGNSMHSERPNHRMYEQWHPYGIVGVISAFNFPVAVWSWNAFLSAICGNVTIWKPSAKTPLCAVAVQHICNQVLKENNCPEIFGLIIPNSHDVVEAMVDDKRIQLISFTGSTAVGKQVAAKVAARLGKSILELGGNNGIILDESADLNLAIPAIVFGAVGTAGQRCTTTRRLFIHESKYQDVIKRLRHAYEQITIGDPLDTRNLMGPLIDQQAVEQFKKAINRIKAAGGQIVYGGEVLKQAGSFVQPTLVCDVKNDWDIVQEETFAPILYVMSYRTLDEAIALHNGVPQGLSSALFTQNLKNAELFLSACGSDCGIANINIGTSGAEIGGAFGGEKETGGGRESGSDSWKAYMRRQTNTINWGDELPLAQGIRFNLS
ncbi:TPA: aldehyde dehydrogenase family protein [Legionella pneumophila subsp. pneumophila]|uniref:L-piperidine-6-carboxylate dehydrogenase n=1 Tax=Legionella pneumophila TaxID=446 RepID=UPI0007709A8E|nr:aldehyde dehydrogenase family protein [Legionella pneumophila]HAT9448698.1 aldehyde dehydrogenase family protein [Legionella pneumophila subsp. pneumophila]CZH29340.1 Succinate-semialdehyde dehydrogenase [NADP(+)] GabD [Legionella pneumophila]HAT1801938.1 aldehyde dehydrogenase family protein [Legionella pneumophila]HAT9694533.1 aldehyde dehydrogenase family protein [Legionella pneumophila subsp. pneumophila]HAT9828350.1 aldehyde dehydrogenase family protein [Legionella pneumophila subsp. p